MARTYDQHKADIDTAYPTPVVEWERQDNHVTYRLYEVASVELAFNAVDFHYLGTHYREGGEELWKIRRVLPNNGRLTVIGGEASWDDAKDAFDTYWEAHCEEQRAILALSAYGKDVVDDQPGESPVARLSFLHLGAPAQTTIPINPGFIDSRFEYAATTVIRRSRLRRQCRWARRCDGSMSTSSPLGRLSQSTFTWAGTSSTSTSASRVTAPATMLSSSREHS